MKHQVSESLSRQTEAEWRSSQLDEGAPAWQSLSDKLGWHLNGLLLVTKTDPKALEKVLTGPNSQEGNDSFSNAHLHPYPSLRVTIHSPQVLGPHPTDALWASSFRFVRTDSRSTVTS